MSAPTVSDVDHEANVSALTRALSTGKLVVFAGAGISISPPAGLPNWLRLRDWTLEAVANCAAFLAPCLATLTNLDMLASPGQKGMTPELVASEIADQCSGYFESLALDPVIASRVLTVGKSVPRAISEAVLAYARSLMESRQLQSANGELLEAERIAIGIGDREWLASVRRSQADLLRAEGRRAEALQVYIEAERIADLTGNTSEVELLRYAMADLAFELGALDDSLSHIESALEAARENQYPAGIAHDLLKLADILAARGDLVRAERSLAEAIPIFHDQRIASQWIESTVKRADLLVEMGRYQEALVAYRSIEPVVQRGGRAMARRRLQEGHRPRRSSSRQSNGFLTKTRQNESLSATPGRRRQVFCRRTDGSIAGLTVLQYAEQMDVML